MNHRRILLIALGAGALTAPFTSLAQQQGRKIWRIGVLGDTPGPQWEEFRRALGELGYKEGQSIALEWRWAEGKPERFPEWAAELVRLRTDVIVAEGTPAASAAMTATSAIPIVLAISGDPVATGLVKSLNRPGGNVTGSSSLSLDLYPKQMELLKEILPGLSRLAVLWKPGNPAAGPAMKNIESAAQALRIQLQLAEVREATGIESAFSLLTGKRPDALLVVADPTIDSVQREIAVLAVKARLPAVFNKTPFAEAGGLLVYGARYSDFFRRAAYYVDRILRGAKPADLPVEQASRFELVINLKTAKALGIKVPQSILVQADRVIE